MVLLLGGSGYVGGAFQRLLAGRGIAFRNVSRAQADYSQTEVLRALIRDVKPTHLINAAGFTGKPNVDACEDQKAETLFGNAVLPGRIREACEAEGVPWGHVASGCIYNGAKADGSGFTEVDEPNFTFRRGPCSFYSGTKALGEEILSGARDCYVWRLRIPFNEVESPRNYLTKLMRYEWLLDARNSLSQLDEFARACWETMERRVPAGVYNVTQPGSVTAREVVALIEKAGVMKKDWKFFSDETDFMARAARTPRSNCVLDVSKLLATGIPLTPVHEAVERALKGWRKAD